MRPKSLCLPKVGVPALWMYVCTLLGLQRDIVNHKENFFFAHERTFIEGQIIRLTGFLAFESTFVRIEEVFD